MVDTATMSEIDLRHLQLREIRHLLGMATDAPHEAVVRRLVDLVGTTNNASLLAAVPERYRRPR